MIVDQTDFIHKKFVTKNKIEKSALIKKTNNALLDPDIIFYGLDFNNNILYLPKYGNTILINGQFDSGKTTLTKLIFSQMMKKNEKSINISIFPESSNVSLRIFENQKTNFSNLSYKTIDSLEPILYLLEKGFKLNIVVRMGMNEDANNKLIDFSQKYKKNLNIIFIADAYTNIAHAKVFSGQQHFNPKYPSSNPYLYLFKKDYSSFLNINNSGLGVYCEHEGLFFSPALKKSKINEYLNDISFTKSILDQNKDFNSVLKIIHKIKNKENFLNLLIS